jgi:hypothetical protein
LCHYGLYALWYYPGVIGLIVIGFGMFLSSFGMFRQRREIAAIPISRCNAITEGRIAINGTAHADQLYASLFAERQAIFFLYTISIWKGKIGTTDLWENIATFTYPSDSSFTLTDDFGSVSVFPDGAQKTASIAGSRDYSSLSQREYIFRPDNQTTIPQDDTSTLPQRGRDVLERYGSLNDTVFRVEEARLQQDCRTYVYGFASEITKRLAVWKGTDGNDFIIGVGSLGDVLLDEKKLRKDRCT